MSQVGACKEKVNCSNLASVCFMNEYLDATVFLTFEEMASQSAPIFCSSQRRARQKFVVSAILPSKYVFKPLDLNLLPATLKIIKTASDYVYKALSLLNSMINNTKKLHK